jgi:hypothetical protein
MATLGCGALVGGAGLVAFWVLFMSWSHNYGSPDFRRDELLVQGLGAGGILGGIALLIGAARRLRQGR